MADIPFHHLQRWEHHPWPLNTHWPSPSPSNIFLHCVGMDLLQLQTSQLVLLLWKSHLTATSPLWSQSPLSLSPLFASESEVAQSCPTLCDPTDYSPPGSTVHGILQARILEWVAISFSRGSSRPRDRTQVSRIAGRPFNLWATREAQACSLPSCKYSVLLSNQIIPSCLANSNLIH